MERSLKSLINSSKEDHMASRTVFPLVVKYGTLHGANTKLWVSLL